MSNCHLREYSTSSCEEQQNTSADAISYAIIGITAKVTTLVSISRLQHEISILSLSLSKYKCRKCAACCW